MTVHQLDQSYPELGSLIWLYRNELYRGIDLEANGKNVKLGMKLIKPILYLTFFSIK